MVRMIESDEKLAAQQGDTQVVERPQVIETPTAEEVRALVEGPTRRPIRWMRWLGVFVVLVAAAAVAALVATMDGAESEAELAEGTRYFISADSPRIASLPVEPLANPADNAYLVVATTPHGVSFDYQLITETPHGVSFDPIVAATPAAVTVAVPRTADGLEGWIEQLDGNVPRTADGAEAWHLSEQAQRIAQAMPRSADGAERWIIATQPEAPIAVFSQLPEGASPVGTVYEHMDI